MALRILSRSLNVPHHETSTPLFMAYNNDISVSYVTDSTWKSFVGFPSRFELPETNDGTWADAMISGKYGVSPGGAMTVGLDQSCV